MKTAEKVGKVEVKSGTEKEKLIEEYQKGAYYSVTTC
jgi:hypothetical protein